MAADGILVAGDFAPRKARTPIDLRSAALPSLVFAACGVLCSFAVLMILAMWSDDLPDRLGFRGWVPIASLLYAAVGARIASSHPKNWLGWLILGIGATYALNTFAEEYAHYAIFHLLRSLPFYDVAAGYAAVAPNIVATLGGLAYLTFPDGRLPSRRWRAVAILVAGLGIVTIVGYALAPRTLPPYSIANPFTPDALWSFRPEAPGIIEALYRIRVVVLVVPLLALLLRVERAHGIERQQLKWVATAGTFSALMFGVYAVGLRDPIIGYAVALGVISVPIALWIAIARYELYQIDAILNGAVVYTSLTAVLGGVYIAMIGVTQRVFQAVTGEQSDAPVILATLAVAGAFTPVRGALQSTVDRRFRRGRPSAGLDALVRDIGTYLVMTDRDRLLRRFLEEAVTAVGAAGGALVVVDSKGERLAYSIGPAVSDVRLSCSFTCKDDLSIRLAFGDRADRGPYTSEHRELLISAAGCVCDLLCERDRSAP